MTSNNEEQQALRKGARTTHTQQVRAIMQLMRQALEFDDLGLSTIEGLPEEATSVRSSLRELKRKITDEAVESVRFTVIPDDSEPKYSVTIEDPATVLDVHISAHAKNLWAALSELAYQGYDSQELFYRTGYSCEEFADALTAFHPEARFG